MCRRSSRATAPRPYPGDKVIQTKNDYELGVMNGAMGVVVERRSEGRAVRRFRWPTRSRSKVAAMRSAISSWPTRRRSTKCRVRSFPAPSSIAHKSHSFMHHRNLLYTAVTRAKEAVIILGDRWGIEQLRRETPGGPPKHISVFPAPPEAQR